MPTLAEVIQVLEQRFLEVGDACDRKHRLNKRHFLSEADYDHRVQEMENEIRKREQDIRRDLQRLVASPPHHERHRQKLAAFYDTVPNSTFDTSVFIMTKFPQGRGKAAKQLQRVIDAVKAGVAARGYVARIATEPKQHDWIWDNVELYLLGCAHGIAIIEDKFKKELNPNIAMEWGWMRAMDRPVLALKEK